jgi:hypothetical protein
MGLREHLKRKKVNTPDCVNPFFIELYVDIDDKNSGSES